MEYSKINFGKSAPEEVNVLIEIPGGGVKYEFDKETGAIWVDRFMNVSMQYPCNYGFIPQTLSGDGDPVDVLVYSASPIHPGALIKVRPVGVLITEDESGEDEKILAVPAAKIDPFFANILEYTDLPAIFLERIVHFFSHYKDLEKNKWVKIKGWQNANHAKEIINKGIANAK